MTRWSTVWLLARRDFLQRARSRAFLVAMLLTVGLVLTIGPLIALATGDEDPIIVGLLDSEPAALDGALTAAAGNLDLEVTTVRIASIAGAEDDLESGTLDVLVDGKTMVWREDPGPRLSAAITAAYTESARRATADELGLTDEDVTTLLRPVTLADRSLREPDPEEEPRRIAAYVGLMVLYISILMFGQFVMMGVMEEKQNRVVEVVLSRVRPVQILAGKVLGIGLLGLIQIIALGGAAMLMLNIIDVADVDLGAIGLTTFATILFWYLLGYSFYSVLYGALGATVSRQEDMQGAVMVPVLMIIPGFFFGNVATEDPSALLAQIGSLVPLWSPMVMPVRNAVGDVSAWELALSIALVIAGIYALTLFGARVYRGAILRLGTRVRLRDAWRSSTD
jgi:ABC-2 type transport system permease protein